MKKFLLGISVLVLFAACTPQNATTQISSQQSDSSLIFSMLGPSMEPTLSETDILHIEKSTDLKRGDIVVFNNPNIANQRLVKRVIGLPGETVKLANNVVNIINAQNPTGMILDEPYLGDAYKNITGPVGEGFDTFKVPQDGYFVLGDARTKSSDSRLCFADSTLKMQDCVDGKTPFYITQKDILGIVVSHEKAAK